MKNLLLIKNKIGIVSCKGGVGKTILSINIAASLNLFFNKKVGLFDCDIYGPNHPKMLGFFSKNVNKYIKLKKQMNPVIRFGIKSMSIGYFLSDVSSVLFRGPLASNTVYFLLKNTIWNNLDYLIIDFPPGTGDTYLTILKNLQLNGVFVVSTMNSMSIEDVIRSIVMLKKYNIPILGLINNMEYIKCSKCSNKEFFYKNVYNLKFLANKFCIKKIYSFPFDITISKSNNFPFIMKCKNNYITELYKNISLDLINLF